MSIGLVQNRRYICYMCSGLFPGAPPRRAAVVQGYYREQSENALARARLALVSRGIKHKEVHLIGDPGATIAAYAKHEKFPLVVMGSHGQGALSSVVLGSVARKVLAMCDTPALIIR